MQKKDFIKQHTPSPSLLMGQLKMSHEQSKEEKGTFTDMALGLAQPSFEYLVYFLGRSIAREFLKGRGILTRESYWELVWRGTYGSQKIKEPEKEMKEVSRNHIAHMIKSELESDWYGFKAAGMNRVVLMNIHEGHFVSDQSFEDFQSEYNKTDFTFVNMDELRTDFLKSVLWRNVYGED